MEGKSEKSDLRKARSAGDRKRKLVLYASASLLLLTFCLAIIFRSVFKSPWFIVGALLLPVTQTVLALVYFDKMRSSFLVDRPSFALEQLSVILSIATMTLTWFAEASDEVSFMISCVFLVWGGMFEVGLGLTTPFHHNQIYSIMAVLFVTDMVKNNCLVCAWLYLIPLFLSLGMITLKDVSVEAAEE